MDLEKLPSIAEIVRDYNLRATKKLGQNFILDLNVTDKIVSAAGDISKHHIIEVGAGPGGLTRSILSQNPLSLTSIEFDERAIEALQSLKACAGDKFNLIHGDALQTNLLNLVPFPRMIIANLPYNISTVLLIRWLEELHKDSNSYSKFILMFQREVAERITARVGDDAYGRLAIMASWLGRARILFDVAPSVFVPPPKVTSSIVEFIPHEERGDKIEFKVLEKLLSDAFGQRRKMVRSSLKNYLPALEKTGIDLTLRAENLTLQNYLDIASFID